MEPDTQNGGGMAKLGIWLVVLLLIIGGIVVYGKRGDEKKEAVTEPIKIGVILPLTGDAASYGEPGQRVYQIAVDEINAEGGIDGQQIELIIEDGKCSGKDATNAMQKLVNVDKVQAVLGGFCSSESLAMVPVATGSKVLVLSPGSSNPGLTGISLYFFRTIPSDASQGSLGAEEATRRGYKKIAFIQEQTDYALGVYVAFDARFKELGGTTVKEEFAPNTTDFKTQLTKLKAAKPDALFIDPQASPAAERIFKQLQDLGWKPQFFINEAVAGDRDTIKKNATLLEGALGAEFSADPANPKFAHLLEVYKAKYNEELPYQTYAQNEYDNVFILRDGIKAVGYNGEKLASWSRTIKNWQGASGSVTIKPDGDRESGYALKVVKGGDVVNP